MEGRLHIYHPSRNLLLFEHTPSSTPQTSSQSPIQTQLPPNILLFVGGLFDNFSIPSYVHHLAQLFPRHASQKWAVCHIQLSSAMRAWGISNLQRDVDEIATCITYIQCALRRDQTDTNIVLMGHSTGCQDTLHYLYSPDHASDQASRRRPLVHGAILQAPVSDREAVQHITATDSTAKAHYEHALEFARATHSSQHTTIIPMHWTTQLFGAAPVSVARFMSLVSPDSPDQPSDDDVFSSDLSPARLAATFGSIGANDILVGTPAKSPSVLILMSDQDEYVPGHVDKAALMARWERALQSGPRKKVDLHAASQGVAGAKHDVSGDDMGSRRARMLTLRKAVLEYIDAVVGGVDETAWATLRAGELEVQSPESEEMVEKKTGELKL